MNYNVWVNDCGWALAGEMPVDGSGINFGAAAREAKELTKEYAADSIMMIPASMEIVNHDTFGVFGNVLVVRERTVGS